MALTKSHKKPAMTTHPRLWWSRVKRSWPFFVWLAVVLISLYFYNTHSRFWGISGVVRSDVETITPLETARLKEILVYQGQRVTAGQVIAKMDTAVLDAEIAVDEARIIESESSIAGFQQNMLQIVRQFESARNDAELALEETRSEKRQAEKKREELQKELDTREDLAARKIIPASELYELRAEVAGLTAAIEGYERTERIHIKAVERAEKERMELQKAMRVDEDDSVAVAIAKKMESRQLILETARAQRMEERERYTLRATRDSLVSRIYAREGDVIRAGSDVVRLVSEKSDIIEGFLPETHVAAITKGQQMRALTQNGRVEYPVEVLSIAPEIQGLPARASPLFEEQARGRRILFQILDPDHAMLPGETVKIRPLQLKLFGNRVDDQAR